MRIRSDRIAESLITHGETPSEFLNNIEMLKPDLDTLGLRWRVGNLMAASAHVRDELEGRVPDSWRDLMDIPGVGDYIASAVLSFAFGRPSVLMDTNTRRIARRVLGKDAKRPDWMLRLFLHELAGEAGPDVSWNQALLDLGALVLQGARPRLWGMSRAETLPYGPPGGETAEMTPRPGSPHEWNEDKREDTLRIRGVDFSLVEQADWSAAIHLRSDREGELRYSSYVPIGDRLYNVVWTTRGSNTRIISLRKANGRETARYEQEKA